MKCRFWDDDDFCSIRFHRERYQYTVSANSVQNISFGVNWDITLGVLSVEVYPYNMYVDRLSKIKKEN